MLNKLLPGLIGSICLLSCSTTSNDLKFAAVHESLRNANMLLRAKNESTYQELESKLKDPPTHRKAALWQPKAVVLRQLSSELIKHIEQLKLRGGSPGDGSPNDQKAGGDFLKNPTVSNELFVKLNDFRSASIGLITAEIMKDSNAFSYLKKNLLDLEEQLPVSNAAELALLLDNSSPAEAMLMLEKFHSDVLVTENMIADYLNMQVSTGCNLGFNVFSAIISQNSKHLKRGEELEINAGIGAFSVEGKPEVFIDGSKVRILPEGVAEYRIVAGGRRGKHSIPVKIEFTDVNGARRIITRNVTYSLID